MHVLTKHAEPVTGSAGILAVVVLYKTLPEESSTLATLLQARMAAPSVRLSIFIADNTPGGEGKDETREDMRYRSYAHNPGLAEPYNDALAMAEKEGYEWLLTLDQDTHLPADFLSKLAGYIDEYRRDESVSTIVPRIFDEGRLISPFRFVGGFWPRVLPETATGIAKRHCSALNSSSLHRVSALREIGGFDARFPLHNSDTDLYLRLDQAGKRVAIAGDIRVEHELSILQREARMSPERYRQSLVDECDFWDLRMSAAGRMERLVRLMGRACKGYLQREDGRFQAVTVGEIKRRLLTRRSGRIRSREGLQDNVFPSHPSQRREG